MKIKELNIAKVDRAAIEQPRELPDGIYLARLQQPIEEAEVREATAKDGSILYYADIPILYKEKDKAQLEKAIVLTIKVATKKPDEEQAKPSWNFIELSKLDTNKWKTLVSMMENTGSILWRKYKVMDE